jgi:hypothetical protein
LLERREQKLLKVPICNIVRNSITILRLSRHI